jgi:hypothetical protein
MAGVPLGQSRVQQAAVSNPPVSTMCVAKRHVDEAPNEEPWSRQKGHDGSPFVIYFHPRFLRRDKLFD